MQKDHIIIHVKDPAVDVDLGGVWKQQSNPACTKGVRVFRVLVLDAIRVKKRQCPLLAPSVLKWYENVCVHGMRACMCECVRA